MKQIYIQIKAPGNIQDVNQANNSSILDRKSINETKLMSLQSGGTEERLLRQGRGLNIFLTQNKGKGPPGRQRSPGTQSHPELPASSLAGGVSGSNAQGSRPRTEFGVTNSIFKNTIHTEQIVYNTQKLNFYLQLNFTNMKKQILILMVALIASVTVAWGQGATHSSIPQPLGAGCTDDPLHPIAGKPYNYAATTSPSGGNYTWWATKNPVLITGTASAMTSMNNIAPNVLTVALGDLLSATTNYNVAGPTDNVGIIWSTKTLANTKYLTNPTFVSVYYTPPVGSGCADNIKAYELDPRNAFTVDILNLNNVSLAAAAYAATESQCVANVTSAKYDAGAHTMDYLYGINKLYFEVVAANFTGSWMPNFKLTGLSGDQTAIAEWSYTNTFPAATTYPINIAAGTTVSVTTTVPDTSNGVSIYVRVTITNNHFETLADQPITLAVDGTNEAGELDIVNLTCTPPATPDWIDTAVQNIVKRPTVTGATVGVGSVPPNVTLIPKGL
jgi:hypothetical protein